MGELKPCPFCGEKPKVTTLINNVGRAYQVSTIVCCKQCLISKQGLREVHIKEPARFIEAISSSEQQAIEAWNRRAE